jgi:hypothetical protein
MRAWASLPKLPKAPAADVLIGAAAGYGMGAGVWL